MENSVKEYLLSADSPDIDNRYYGEIYYSYWRFAKNKNYYPVSKNKFSRDIRKLGFTTKVCRDYYTGRCKRLIIMPEEVREFILASRFKKQ